MSDDMNVGKIVFNDVPQGVIRDWRVNIKRDARGTQDLHERVTTLEEIVKQQQKEIEELKTTVQSLIDSLTSGK